jgi:ribosomal protein S18 acetylase RimI-like enzyme
MSRFDTEYPMESFRIDGASDRDYAIRVDEVVDVTPELVRTLIEIDLQTFAESTYSPYTAAAFLKCGRVYLLRADETVIGTCVCMRAWDRPNEAMILSMGIRPGWRGRGLGQRFVQHVLDKLRNRGLRSCVLLVGQDNRRAVKVYQDVGFRVVEQREVEPQHHDVLLLMRVILQDEDAPVIELKQ